MTKTYVVLVPTPADSNIEAETTTTKQPNPNEIGSYSEFEGTNSSRAGSTILEAQSELETWGLLNKVIFAGLVPIRFLALFIKKIRKKAA